MKLDHHLTTDPASGVLASGYQSWRYSDAQKVYYTVEAVKNMRRFHAGGQKARSGDVGGLDAIDAYRKKVRKNATTRVCIVCEEEFLVTRTNRGYKTCGTVACVDEARRRTARMGRAAQLAAGIKLRRCVVCDDPLPENAHGNVKVHTWCREDLRLQTRKARESA